MAGKSIALTLKCLKNVRSSVSRQHNIFTSANIMMRRPLDDLEDDNIETIQVSKYPERDEHHQQAGVSGGTGTGSSMPVSEYEGPLERSLNQVTLLGRVGADPQIRGSEDRPVTAFRLATNSAWKNVNQRAGEPEWTQKTEWHNCVVFKPGLRETAFNNVNKGSRIHITGRLMYGEYMDKQGITRQTTSIVCEDIIYLTRKNNMNDPYRS